MNEAKSELIDIYLEDEYLVVKAERKIPLTECSEEFVNDIISQFKETNGCERIYKDGKLSYILKTMVLMDSDELLIQRKCEEF